MIAPGLARSVAEQPLTRRAVLRFVPAVLERMFDPGAAKGLDATLELTVTDPAGQRGARYGLRIADERCTVVRGEAPDAKARVRLAADDMLILASRQVGWPELLSSGRLVMSGDPYLALRFPSLFRISPGD